MKLSRGLRMENWKRMKLEFRNAGRRNWKAGKKAIKRVRRDLRMAQNALIDNATLAV